jgi:hypothetical protein
MLASCPKTARVSAAADTRSRIGPTYITLPPLAVQSLASAASVKPWPLQAFWPLQAELALLQALWPLQAFEPPHFTPAAKEVDAKLVAAKTETAVAISVRLFMRPSWLDGLTGPHVFIRSLGLRRYRRRADLLV